MWVVKYRKIFYAFSGLLIIGSAVSMLVWGLKPGLDFTGGTLVEVQYPQNMPSQEELISALSPIDKAVSVRPSGADEYIIRMKAVDQTEKAQVFKALAIGGAVPVEKAFDSVGPILGEEALRKALVSIALVLIGIVLFITLAFRKVSEPVSSWKYGFTAIIALAHDIIIPAGVFSVLGHFAGYEVDTLFVTALLVVLGFSVHDTIVVFDRVRENLRHAPAKMPFMDIVGQSVSQTFTRSINTSLTTLIALVVLYILGGPTISHFVLALIVGIAAGTYSSIFIGSPLLVTLERMQAKKSGRQ